MTSIIGTYNSGNILNLYPCFLQECFHMEETMGIIGGRPNSAYYFIGYQGHS